MERGGSYTTKKDFSFLSFQGRDKGQVKVYSDDDGLNLIFLNLSKLSQKKITIYSKKSHTAAMAFFISGSFKHTIKNKSYKTCAPIVSIIPFHKEEIHEIEIEKDNNCSFGLIEIDLKLLAGGVAEHYSRIFEKARFFFNYSETEEFSEKFSIQEQGFFEQFLNNSFVPKYQAFFKKFHNDWAMKIINFSADNPGNNLSKTKDVSLLLRSYDFDQLEVAKRLLEDNLTNPPSIKEISRQVGINDNKLKYAFKQVYGVTMNGYVREKRIEKAIKLIESDYNSGIYEIAEKVGYSNKGHFAQRFKEIVGLLPKDYQKEIRKKKA